MSFHHSDGAPRMLRRRAPAPASPGRPADAPSRPSRAQGTSARRLRDRLLALPLVLAFVLVPSVVGAASPTGTGAGGVTHAASSAPSEKTPTSETVSTSLVSMTPTVVMPGDTVRVVVKIHNGTDKTLTAPKATLGVNWRLVTTRSALDAWANAPVSQRPAEAMAVEEVGPLGAGKDTTVTFEVEADLLNLENGSTWGPRPLSVMVSDGGERLDVLRSFFLWGESTEPGPVSLSLIAPVTGPALDLAPSTGRTGAQVSDAAAGQVADAVGSDQRLGRLLAATSGHPEIAWAVDPALVATAAASSDPESVAWATRFQESAAGRTVFGLRPYDPDAAAYAQIGAPLPGPATPLPAGAAPDPAWRTDLTYPGDDVPDERTVAAGVQAGSPLVVVRGGGLAPADSVSYTPTGLATVPTDAGDATALVADDALTTSFVEATSHARVAAQGGTVDATQRLLADAAVVASQRPTDARHLLIALPRSWDPNPAALATVLDALGSASWIEISPVENLLATGVPDVDRVGLPASAVAESVLSADEMTSLQRARTDVATFSTIATDPASLVLSVEPALVAPTSVAFRTEPEERETAVTAALADAAAVQGAVSVVPRGSDILLINTSGMLPVYVRNTLDQAVTVQVALRPDSSLLRVVSFPVGPVPAGESVDFKVPVEAIGSGTVNVSVQLLAVPTGAAVSAPSEFPVQVRAEWENTGTAIFSALLGLLLVAGIWRTIRRGRSPRRVSELTPAAGVPTAQGASASSGRTTGDES